MDTSRQNPNYSGDRSLEDALAIVTAAVTGENSPDPDVMEAALRNGLEGTDHTMLVYNLGLIVRTIATIAANQLEMPREEFSRGMVQTAMRLMAEDPE